MSENGLKYTSLTNEDILSRVYERFLKDNNGNPNEKFDNFRESSIAQTLIEIFTGVVDINNYYIQRRAEECYFDTAQLKSSVISLSRMFGYVMNRREPSRAKLKMIITGDIKDNQIQIPYFSKFSFDGKPYVLRETMTYRIPEDIYNNMNSDTIIEIDLDSYNKPIEIIQGEIKEKVFSGISNQQVNAPFQIYKIEDKTFSNVYGENDFFYNNVTQVYVGENKTEDTRFDIDRRSLLNWKTIDTSNISKSHKVCVIRTATDGNIEILFGDGDDDTVATLNTSSYGGFARKGAITRKDNIYVQYLSVEGSVTNKTGVIGEEVKFSGKIYNSVGDDISNNVKFKLITNIYGGGDDESLDSIKYSSPKIYYSLDRLVSKQDYIAFLKSLNSPINVKNAIAWGEQEERDLAKKFAIYKMFNAVLFSVVGSLYDLDASPHIPKIGDDYNDVVLDLNYNPNAFQLQGYFNIFIIQEMVTQLNRYNTKSSFYELLGDVFLDNNGDEMTSTQIYNQIKNNIDSVVINDTMTFSFEYTTDIRKYMTNIIGSDSVKVSGLSALNGLLDDTYLEKLADIINIQLSSFKDLRSNRTDNANFDKIAFYGRFPVQSSPNKIIKWDKIKKRFAIRFNDSVDNVNQSQSPCYIDSILPTDLGNIIGMNGSVKHVVTIDVEHNEMNGKISKVVNELNSRSQVNVKNIYMSPIIHQFDIVGNVRIKSLYDLLDTRREITDKLYKWLDINADFNVPLYLSNIIEIFEAHPGVVNVDIKLQPHLIKYEEPNYIPSQLYNSQYHKYTMKGIEVVGEDFVNTITVDINKCLNQYLFGSDADFNDFEDKYNELINDINNGYTNNLKLNHITERSFYGAFAGDLYLKLKNESNLQTCENNELICSDNRANYEIFIGVNVNLDDNLNQTVIDSDFSKVIENVYKDIKPIIMNNLLDTHYNISREYDDDNIYIKGGYSLGSEIVQVLTESGYEDNNNNFVPLLKFKYQ